MQARPDRCQSRDGSDHQIGRTTASKHAPDYKKSRRPHDCRLKKHRAHATSEAVGLGITFLSIGAGCLRRNQATYNAGRKISVRTVATRSPPMTAIAMGPQNIVTAIGIKPSTVET